MDVFPTGTATNFTRLAPGELFIFWEDIEPRLCLRAIDAERRSVLVALGPTFPGDTNEPYVLHRSIGDVVSFGSDFVVRLPTDPMAWLPRPPDDRSAVVMLIDKRPCLRANRAHSPSSYEPGLVELATGEAGNHVPPTAPSVRTWEILLPFRDELVSVLKYVPPKA